MRPTASCRRQIGWVPHPGRSRNAALPRAPRAPAPPPCSTPPTPPSLPHLRPLCSLEISSPSPLPSHPAPSKRSFPERLCAIYLWEAGLIFHSLYYLVEPWIDA